MNASYALTTFAAAAGSLILSAGTSFAMPVPASAPVTRALVEDVAFGCGVGWHPNRWGYCVRNYPRPHVYGWYGPVYRPAYVHHHAWHRPVYGWHGHRWHHW